LEGKKKSLNENQNAGLEAKRWALFTRLKSGVGKLILKLVTKSGSTPKDPDVLKRGEIT